MEDKEFDKWKDSFIKKLHLEVDKSNQISYKGGLLYGALYTSLTWGILLYVFEVLKWL